MPRRRGCGTRLLRHGARRRGEPEERQPTHRASRRAWVTTRCRAINVNSPVHETAQFMESFRAHRSGPKAHLCDGPGRVPPAHSCVDASGSV